MKIFEGMWVIAEDRKESNERMFSSVKERLGEG